MARYWYFGRRFWPRTLGVLTSLNFLVLGLVNAQDGNLLTIGLAMCPGLLLRLYVPPQDVRTDRQLGLSWGAMSACHAILGALITLLDRSWWWLALTAAEWITVAVLRKTLKNWKRRG